MRVSISGRQQTVRSPLFTMALPRTWVVLRLRQSTDANLSQEGWFASPDLTAGVYVRIAFAGAGSPEAHAEEQAATVQGAGGFSRNPVVLSGYTGVQLQRTVQHGPLIFVRDVRKSVPMVEQVYVTAWGDHVLTASCAYPPSNHTLAYVSTRAIERIVLR